MMLEEVCIVGLSWFMVLVILCCVVEHHGLIGAAWLPCILSWSSSLYFGSSCPSALSFTLLFR